MCFSDNWRGRKTKSKQEEVGLKEVLMDASSWANPLGERLGSIHRGVRSHHFAAGQFCIMYGQHSCQMEDRRMFLVHCLFLGSLSVPPPHCPLCRSSPAV